MLEYETSGIAVRYLEKIALCGIQMVENSKIAQDLKTELTKTIGKKGWKLEKQLQQ